MIFLSIWKDNGPATTCDSCREKIDIGHTRLVVDSRKRYQRFHISCFLKEIRLLWNEGRE
jgi:hypothetical protein